MAEALSDKQSELDCDGFDYAECPNLIRPAASLACVRYYESTVEQCVEEIAEYSRCSDFRLKACYPTAAIDERSEGCTPPGPPDAGPDAGDETPSDGNGGEPESEEDASVPPPAALPDAAAPPDAGDERADAGADAGTPDASPDAG